MFKWLLNLFSGKKKEDLPKEAEELIEKERNIEIFSNGPKRPSDK